LQSKLVGKKKGSEVNSPKSGWIWISPSMQPNSDGATEISASDHRQMAGFRVVIGSPIMPVAVSNVNIPALSSRIGSSGGFEHLTYQMDRSKGRKKPVITGSL
jgi:hypothetical protein